MNKIRLKLSLCLIIFIVFVAFLPLFKNGFVNWDDNNYVTDNATVRSLSVNHVKDIFTSFYMGNYHPVTMLSYLFEYHFFKLNPFGYHAVSLLLHLSNCILVYFLILLLTNRLSVALITSIFWGIHPLAVESVAWISEMKGLLSAFFYLWAAICYVYYLRKNYLYKAYYFAFLFFILALLSKPIALTLPLMFLLLDHLLNRLPSKRAWMDKVPFFLLSFIFGIISVFAQDSFGAVRKESLFNLLDKMMVAAYCITFYLYKLLFPFNLSSYYPYPSRIGGFLPLQFFCSLFIVIILYLVVIFSKKYTKKVLFGSFFFLIAIFPTLQFVPVSASIIADRYVYIASIGIFYILAELIFWLFTNKIRCFRLVRVFTLGLLFIAVGGLSFFTWQRCKVWKDSISLWSDVLKKYPNATTAYNSRGAEYLVKKEYAKAYADFMNTLSIDKNYYEAYFNLGSLYSSTGNYNEAVKLLNKTLQINRGCLKAYDMLATIYGLMGKHAEAINISIKAIQIKHDFVQAYINLCSASGKLGNFQKAIAYGEKAIAINPELPLAQMNLSAAYFYAKKYDLAIKHCDRALALGYEVNPKYLAEIKIYRK